MTYDMKKSGERIRRLRIESGYTQEEAAELLHIDRSFLSRIESGRKGCSVDLLVHISVLFDASLDYIVLGETRSQNYAERVQLKADIEALMRRLEKFSAAL